MSKVAHYLQEHLIGEVMISSDARKYFSKDASIFNVTPLIVVYPRNENDVRKTARFTWQLAERGRVIPITARGSGTDLSGAAIGSGIVMVFPAHMNRIINLDTKNNYVSVEPGINFAKLQQTLHTHYRFLPPYPASLDYSTIGGAVANNAGGEKSVKYGNMRQYVKSLRVILANGEVIETKRLNKREVSKKMGLATFEGEIYRGLDALLEENHEIIENSKLPVSKNSAGYNLADIKSKDGSIDLTPLLVGSQGTLGIVTEIVLDTEPYNPNPSLLVAFFDEISKVQSVILKLRKLSNSPSAVELVDDRLLKFVDSKNPNLLKNALDKPFKKAVLLIEFDDSNDRTQKQSMKKAIKILEDNDVNYRSETDPEQVEQLWKVRHSSSLLLSYNEANARALPFVEDGIVPIEKFQEYVDGIYEIMASNNIDICLWGHAGDANLHMQPLLDLSKVGDRQVVFKVMDEYYDLIIALGGSTTGENGDGRIRGPYLSKLYSQPVYDLFTRVKTIFDPHQTLNPGVKVNVSYESIKSIIRADYGIESFYQHMPRS